MNIFTMDGSDLQPSHPMENQHPIRLIFDGNFTVEERLHIWTDTFKVDNVANILRLFTFPSE